MLIATGSIVLIFVAIGGFVVYLLCNDKGGGRRRHVATVELLRPQAPDRPPPKEKLPEPEMQRKEDIQKVETISGPQAPGPQGDDKPAPSGPLGLDSDGTAGSDGFGLAGRKGGRDVVTLGTGGGGDEQAGLMRKFGWYMKLIQDEMRTLVRKHLDQNGGIPRGKHEAVIMITMDNSGVVTDFRIVRSSGNKEMDEAVQASLRRAKVSRPLPKGIHKRLEIRIASQG